MCEEIIIGGVPCRVGPVWRVFFSYINATARRSAARALVGRGAGASSGRKPDRQQAAGARRHVLVRSVPDWRGDVFSSAASAPRRGGVPGVVLVTCDFGTLVLW